MVSCWRSSSSTLLLFAVTRPLLGAVPSRLEGMTYVKWFLRDVATLIEFCPRLASRKAEELRRQVDRHVKERGSLEAELARRGRWPSWHQFHYVSVLRSLARLRAEVRALVAEVQELRLAPSASPLAMAEQWAGIPESVRRCLTQWT